MKPNIMKNLLLGLVCVLFFISCKKDSNTIAGVEIRDLQGSWDWETTTGWCMHVTPGLTGENARLTFSAENKYSLHFYDQDLNNSIIVEGTFTLINKKDINGISRCYINFSNNHIQIPYYILGESNMTQKKISIEEVEGVLKLIIRDDASFGFGYQREYTKVSRIIIF